MYSIDLESFDALPFDSDHKKPEHKQRKLYLVFRLCVEFERDGDYRFTSFKVFTHGDMKDITDVTECLHPDYFEEQKHKLKERAADKVAEILNEWSEESLLDALAEIKAGA